MNFTRSSIASSRFTMIPIDSLVAYQTYAIFLSPSISFLVSAMCDPIMCSYVNSET